MNGQRPQRRARSVPVPEVSTKQVSSTAPLISRPSRRGRDPASLDSLGGRGDRAGTRGLRSGGSAASTGGGSTISQLAAHDRLHLVGLLFALEARDQGLLRHAVAVGRFARDIAHAAGMSTQDGERAYRAGLLHDLGHLAVSDRVLEGASGLTEQDWLAIQQHPALGATFLAAAGGDRQVQEVVLAHHERVDGRGYPKGLSHNQIPELAKIVAVAEVYDTLTANGTYRSRMSSFKALRELRRVAGTQLDGRYVEILTSLLRGRGIAYRHADEAHLKLDVGRIAEL